jgi:Domain of unknown function (DUF4173)
MTRTIALRILALAAAIGLAAQAVLFESLAGINVPILVIATLGAALVVRPADARLDRLDLWLPVTAVVLAGAVAVRADPTLFLFDTLAIATALGASMAAIGGTNVTRSTVVRVVELGFLVLGWVGIGVLQTTATLRLADHPEASDGTRLRRRVPAWARPVLRGLVIAVPIVAVFAALFASADLLFDQLMSRLFTWDVDLGLLPVRLAIAFIVAWGIAGLLAIAAGSLTSSLPAERPVPIAQSLGAAAAGLPSTDRAPSFEPIRLGSIEAATVLLAVDALFALFVIVQLTYLFGGQESLSVTGLPYAEYARSGFFQLVFVAFLAGGLLAVVHALADRRTTVLVGAGVALAGLTGAVLVSALIRLRIYQEAYGWTELRFYVLAAIVWLAMGIGITIVLLVRNRMAWLLHGLAAAGIAVLLVVNVVGPSRVIAEQNVARVLDPTLVPRDGKPGLDLRYATDLGDDAIPALVRALPVLVGNQRAELLDWLQDRQKALAAPEARGWTAWNLGREEARAALATLPARP